MSRKRVFLLTGATLAVYRKQAKELVRSYVFENNQAGLQEFVTYLNEDPWTPVCFLVDFMEEEFRVESIPHVFGSDRRALVMNRERRLFRNTPYRHTVLQNREIGGRRDDNILFAAVTHPEVVQRWLHPIAERKIPLIGLYSLSILSKRLLRYIEAIPGTGISDHVLLVHCNADGGLRQSFFYRQHLKVSRLAAVPRFGEDDAVFGYIPGEVENIRRYLGSLRLLPSEHPLEVYFLGRTRMWTQLERQVINSPNIRYHFVDIKKVGAEIGILGGLDTPYADPLFVGILLRSVPANHYAPPNEIRYFRSAQIRMAMYAVGLVLLTMGIVLGMLQLSDILIIRQKTTVLARQAQAYEDHYAHTSANSPGVSVDGSTLKAAVETAVTLRESKTTPYRMLLVLSEVLDRKSDLEIEEIEWSVSADPDFSVGTHAIPQDKPEIGMGSSPASPMPSSDKTLGDTYQITSIKGRIAAFSGDYRRAIILVEDLAKALSQIDMVEDVRIIRRPLNIGSEETLTGKAGVAPGSANFVLRTVVRNQRLQ
uniref:Uncharacterized protein n=1 Tax=Candidatus Kentrum sp. LFY TaxID=2126342 RepID=A0A450UMM0_9GAMM|nr:MAG: hypothetical protein BECKLFY1418A_GA0070994_10344 [Candidatus Kentron sp. LFY]